MSKFVSYKSYCWSIGTTSFRTDNFNVNIERQLELMDEFRRLPNNAGADWKANNDLQKDYYAYLKSKDFVTGDAPNPAKDAREKTSGLVDIGLLDSNRNLTEVGRALLSVAKSNDFKSDNFLEIQKDSFIYFKQLLKTHNNIEGKTVRPFIVFLHLMDQLEFLTNDEFTYLLPLCIDKETTEFIIDEIRISRETGKLNYEDIIVSVLMKMDNYKEALSILQTHHVTEDVICEIGINRKSAKYDIPYYKIYVLLKDIVFDKKNNALELLEATKKLTNSKVGTGWRKALFRSQTRSLIVESGNAMLNNIPILKSTTIELFNENFFKMMHLYKAEATLSDYFDLNRRYFKATDTVIFEDSKIELDILPMCYISVIDENLLNLAFEEPPQLYSDTDLRDIAPCLEINIEKLYEVLGEKLKITISSKNLAKQVIENKRYERFNKLIDEKFSTRNIITLLTYFENRNDDEIRKMITDNADVPTMFEYILGISWYVISGRRGNALEYMNLSLDADLLPKTHAGGGEADIVWEYEQTKHYPKHTMLIEATLAEGNNQRRMEMEPVSRHLGDYMLKNKDEEAYCTFITTYLNYNVISDFRGRRYIEYYDNSGDNYIEGMKILPLQTSELKILLLKNARYPEIYKMFDNAFNSPGKAKDWYEGCIVAECDNIASYKAESGVFSEN